MNIFEDAIILADTNKRIESRSQDSAIGYKPMDENLSPQQYYKHGHLRGQQEVLEELIEAGLLTVHDLKKLYK